MDLKNLIEKTEIQRKTILELINKAETKEEVYKELAVERFLKGFLTDLKLVDKHQTEQCAINDVVPSCYCKNALNKIIEMNRQNALDQYGDAEKAENWSCVTVAREAISKCN